jgi:sugar phosphate permease
MSHRAQSITAQGIGAALSTALAGLVVVGAGYSAAFLTLATAAAVGLVLFLIAMPETTEEGGGHLETDWPTAVSGARYPAE